MISLSHLMASTDIIKTIDIRAKPTIVWRIITDPSQIKLWLSDSPVDVISDWVVGDTIIFRGKVNGNYEYKGTILKLDLEKEFEYTSWSKILRLEDKSENYSVIRFRLTPIEEGTRLEVNHCNLIAEASYEHSNFYWNSALAMIKKISEST